MAGPPFHPLPSFPARAARLPPAHCQLGTSAAAASPNPPTSLAILPMCCCEVRGEAPAAFLLHQVGVTTCPMGLGARDPMLVPLCLLGGRGFAAKIRRLPLVLWRPLPAVQLHCVICRPLASPFLLPCWAPRLLSVTIYYTGEALDGWVSLEGLERGAQPPCPRHWGSGEAGSGLEYSF